MTPQQIVGLGIRLFAIWLALDVVRWVLRGIGAPEEYVQAAFGHGALVSALIHAVAAILLWNFPMWVAHKLIPRTAHDNALNVSLFDVARVGCALIGLWILAATLQNILWFLITALVASGSGSFFAGLSAENRITFATDIGQAALGLLLMFQSAWFARIVSKSQ